jgi:hypothetical protein
VAAVVVLRPLDMKTESKIRQAELVSKAPPSVRRTLEKAFEGSSSPRQAIKAMCLTCTNYDREEIRCCRVFSCPLRRYRPFQLAE